MALVPNPEHRAWVMQVHAILSAIVGSLTPSVSGLVLFATMEFDAWTHDLVTCLPDDDEYYNNEWAQLSRSNKSQSEDNRTIAYFPSTPPSL
jgi:hypothetical protein